MTAAAVSALLVAAHLAARAALASSRRAAVAARVGGALRAGFPGSAGHGARPAWEASQRDRRCLPPAWFTARWDGAATGVPAPPAWRALLVAVPAATASAAVVGGAGSAALTFLATVGAPAVLVHVRRGASDARLAASLPAAMESIARSLRAGATLPQAISDAAPSAPPPLDADLARVAAGAGRGDGLAASIDRWADRRRLPAVRLAAAALALAAELGGAQARAVDGVAATLRQRAALAGEVRALSAQARLSAAVISLAPIGFGVLAGAVDARTARFLFGTPVGLALLVSGIALDVAGALWMARLTRVDP